MPQTIAISQCPDRNAWSGFYAGKVDQDDLGELAAHLDGCPACQAILRSLGDTTADEADVLVAGLKDVSPAPDAYEVEPECRVALERLRLILPGVAAKDAEPVPVNEPTPLPDRLGEYRILELIGRGGMGTVYRAVHSRLDREVALKVVPPERAGNATAQARFHREMAALGKLDHPNVVRATDAGEVNGVTYLVMDLVEGIDLSRLVRKLGSLLAPDACELARQAATGLQHLATHGLVHRDVKPSNLMLSRRREVKILDLGLAADDRVQATEALTGNGQIVGTFDYLSPEQADPGSPVDARADVYGLGCTLFFLLTGRPPYSGPNHATTRNKILGHTTGPVADVRDAKPEIPAELSSVLKRMMAKNPDERFATPADAASALAPFCAGNDLGKVLNAAGIEPLSQAQPSTPSLLLPTTAPSHPRRSTRLVVAASVVALLLLGGGLTAAIRLWVLPPSERTPDLAAIPGPDDTPKPDTQPEKKDPQPEPPPPAKPVYPVALFNFEERGAKEFGPKVSDLLFAKLSAKPDLNLVDRTDLKKILEEQQLNQTGAVKADEAIKVGQLTGAKLIVTGSVIQIEKKLYLSAKIIGTETSRVAGASVEGNVSDDLGAMAGRLADEVEASIVKNVEKLVPKPAAVLDRIVELNKKLGKGNRPVLFIQVGERHIGQPAVDPAAQTEVMRFAKETGFELIDADEGGRSKADILITGEGFSEVAGRVGGMVSVRARVELKAVDRKTGKVLAVDRQTALVVDISEQIAGKTALQAAAADLAERLLPKIAKADKK